MKSEVCIIAISRMAISKFFSRSGESGVGLPSMVQRRQHFPGPEKLLSSFL